MKKLFKDRLIRKYFQKLFIQFLGISILPILLLYTAFSFILIPNERKNMESSTMISLNLVKENINLLFNDTSKIMNIIDSSISSYALMQTFESNIEGYIGSYVEFLTCKQIAQQMNSIVNTRDYIESVYVYLPNSKNAYITNQMNVYHIESSPDKTWLLDVESSLPNDIFRRHISGKYHDTITITERNYKDYIVAVNINASYFEKLFGSMAIVKGQKMMLIKDNGTIIASNSEHPGTNDKTTTFSTDISNFNCTLISIMPDKELFSYEYNLLLVTIIISIICIIASLLASLYCSYRMTNRINDIIILLRNSANGCITDNTKPYKNDVYGYITNHLIRTFLLNDYLKIALSKKKMELKVQELSALQYQINPHFLSNTLQMIDFEILKTTKSPCSANSMIECLSRFLQYSLRAPEQVLLWQEIKATKNYTELMQYRFQNQISFRWEIDEESMNLEMPKLILQPLIENSIHHNAQKLNKPLMITINATTNSKETILCIKDNGIGTSPSKIAEIEERIKNKDTKENHIGLSNIIRRMELMFSTSFHYRLISSENNGFTVELRLYTTQ